VLVAVAVGVAVSVAVAVVVAVLVTVGVRVTVGVCVLVRVGLGVKVNVGGVTITAGCRATTPSEMRHTKPSPVVHGDVLSLAVSGIDCATKPGAEMTIVQVPVARETGGEAKSFAWPSLTAGTHAIPVLPSNAWDSKSPFDIGTVTPGAMSWPTALVMSTPVVLITVTKYRDIRLFAGVDGPLQSPTSIDGEVGFPGRCALATEKRVKHRLTEAIRTTSRTVLACMKCLHVENRRPRGRKPAQVRARRPKSLSRERAPYRKSPGYGRL
jgi:hypothetical protein